MNLELLPNEIFLDLFDYLNGIDLLRAFYGLNFRFNFLLYNQFRAYYFSFNSVRKRNFDMICQQHLPTIADRVIALSLSDDEDTPEQINLFLSYVPSFKQFTQLRLLSFSYVNSCQTLLKVLDKCHLLCNLTHLKLFSFDFQGTEEDFQLIVDSIWSLPKLIHFRLMFGLISKELLWAPTKISSTLEFVEIYGKRSTLNMINRLVEYTHCLKRLSISLSLLSHNDYIQPNLSTLTYLNINIDGSAEYITKLFQNIPNLRHLDINLIYRLIDGHRWEQIIRNYLPKLKVFRLKMYDTVSYDHHIEKLAGKLFDSFRNSFWIDEHQWFVRCFTWGPTVHLSTSPKKYTFNDIMFPDSWRSTYLHDDPYEYYNSMGKIIGDTFFDRPIPSYIRIHNIQRLHVKLPISDQFWSIVPNLNQLYSLSVSFHVDNFQSQLQTLLDRASHLHDFKIHQDISLPLQTSLFEYTNASVRRLNLGCGFHHFMEEECRKLTRSSLGVQCEVLHIWIKNRESILVLVQNMINLRTLVVLCASERNHERLLLTNNDDELIQWLKDRLPSTCMVVRSIRVPTRILIWI